MLNKILNSMIFAVFLVFCTNHLFAGSVDSSQSTSLTGYKHLKTELKNGIRNIFENVNKNLPKEDFGTLPMGLEIVEGSGFRGIKITQGMFDFRTYTWVTDTGLLDEYNACKKNDDSIVAAVNGTFYSERGALGTLITDGEVSKVKQIPGRLSRCFLCGFRGAKEKQFWYLGETALHASELLRKHAKEMVWFNGKADDTVSPENLIGGGGWILKDRKDAHWEAIERQYFRFRPEDQTSRKTVIAQDTSRNLYFLVFEAGFTLHRVAREFVKNKIFSEVRDAIFLDGGSSSCIVLNGKYLVAPLYMVDRARFSCIQILTPNNIFW